MPSLRLVAASACAAILCTAIAPRIAAQEITLYEQEQFRGRTFYANGSTGNLEQAGFNDRASSAVIRSGNWQLCTDAFYRGRCVTLGPGDYPSLDAMGLGNNRVSSMREVGWSGGGGGGGGGRPPGGVVLYDDVDFRGRSYAVAGQVDNLSDVGFNDRAQSMIIRGNATWELCTDAFFRGNCQRFGPGEHRDLGSVGRRVSSARPVRGERGSGSGGGDGGWGNWGGGGHARVVLYEGTGFSGRSFVVDSDYLPNLATAGFNDRASSARIERGYWLFCSDAMFRGECRTAGPGDYPSVPPGLDNRISSVRRISNDYPYRTQPEWGR